jgi:hypothetical protein
MNANREEKKENCGLVTAQAELDMAQTIIKQPQAWLTFETIFLSHPSALKVSLALVCLLALLLLYRVLW